MLDLSDGSIGATDGTGTEIIQEGGENQGGVNADVNPESLAVLLENTISTLATVDFNSNREGISQILTSEIDLLQNVNPDAAAMVSSARALVDAGAGDADSITLLLQNAIAQLRGQ